MNLKNRHNEIAIDSNANKPESLYKQLYSPTYKDRPYEQQNLGEGMTLVNQVIGQYWKPRYLMEGLSQKILARAKSHSFHFPGHIYQYQNGIAEVEWQLNPDGMYYQDEDGFGMTDDEEINLYGAIDRKGKVVKKFTLKR